MSLGSAGWRSGLSRSWMTGGWCASSLESPHPLNLCVELSCSSKRLHRRAWKPTERLQKVFSTRWAAPPRYSLSPGARDFVTMRRPAGGVGSRWRPTDPRRQAPQAGQAAAPPLRPVSRLATPERSPRGRGGRHAPDPRRPPPLALRHGAAHAGDGARARRRRLRGSGGEEVQRSPTRRGERAAGRISAKDAPAHPASSPRGSSTAGPRRDTLLCTAFYRQRLQHPRRARRRVRWAARTTYALDRPHPAAPESPPRRRRRGRPHPALRGVARDPAPRPLRRSTRKDHHWGLTVKQAMLGLGSRVWRVGCFQCSQLRPSGSRPSNLRDCPPSAEALQLEKASGGPSSSLRFPNSPRRGRPRGEEDRGPDLRLRPPPTRRP